MSNRPRAASIPGQHGRRSPGLIIPLLAGLLAMSCGRIDTDPGLIIHSVNGYTMTAAGEIRTFEAIGIRGGKVVMTGHADSVRSVMEDAVLQDGQGMTLLPGLIDAHVHVMGLGYLLTEADLTGLTSLEETLDALAAFAEAHPEAPWILGRGWNQVLWEGKEFPTARDIDRVIPDRPVFLSRIDGHAGWANSRAMELAGVSRDTPDTRAGRVIRTPMGDPTGVFIDEAEQLITAIIPGKTPAQREQALQAALQEMVRHGLTGAHDAGIDEDTWSLFRRFESEGRMPLRLYAMLGGLGEATEPLLEAGPVSAQGDSRLALRSVKLYSDGALGSRGAAMIEHYHDDPGNNGLLFLSQDEMNESVLKVMRAGFQANVHAIGDAGNRQVLDAFANAYAALRAESDDVEPGSFRNRVEHAQIVAQDDIPRFKTLGLIASMQPTHATSDMNMAEDRVGSQRILGGYAWKQFLDQGTVVAAGSDVPVEHVNPFFGLHAAVTRQDRQGMPPGGWYPAERLSRLEALRAFTLDAAYAAFDEDRIGTLEPGKLADFILIDRDYFAIPEQDLWRIQVMQTWVGGEKVFDASGEDASSLPEDGPTPTGSDQAATGVGTP